VLSGARAELGWEDAIGRFVASFHRHAAAACDFNLYVIFKGSPQRNGTRGRSRCSAAKARSHFHGDESFDIGAYAEAATQIAEQSVRFLNTNAEILCDDWLLKLASNLEQPGVGLVGATGSYELRDLDPRFPGFPNIHTFDQRIFDRSRSIFCDCAPVYLDGQARRLSIRKRTE
jgi:hypothetical protein